MVKIESRTDLQRGVIGKKKAQNCLTELKSKFPHCQIELVGKSHAHMSVREHMIVCADDVQDILGCCDTLFAKVRQTMSYSAHDGLPKVADGTMTAI